MGWLDTRVWWDVEWDAGTDDDIGCDRHYNSEMAVEATNFVRMDGTRVGVQLLFELFDGSSIGLSDDGGEHRCWNSPQRLCQSLTIAKAP
jgi:hypothetical protein